MCVLTCSASLTQHVDAQVDLRAAQQATSEDARHKLRSITSAVTEQLHAVQARLAHAREQVRGPAFCFHSSIAHLPGPNSQADSKVVEVLAGAKTVLTRMSGVAHHVGQRVEVGAIGVGHARRRSSVLTCCRRWRTLPSHCHAGQYSSSWVVRLLV